MRVGNNDPANLASWTCAFNSSWNFNLARPYIGRPRDANWTTIDPLLDQLHSKGYQIITCFGQTFESGYYGSPAWIDENVALAKRLLNDPRIYAIQPKGEAPPRTWHSSVTNLYQWKQAWKKCADAMRAAGWIKPIVTPADIELATNFTKSTSWIWESELQSNPMIFDFHFYVSGWVSYDIPDLERRGGENWAQYFINKLSTFLTKHPNIETKMLECGPIEKGAAGSGFSNMDDQIKGFVKMASYCISKNIDFALWHYRWNCRTDVWKGLHDNMLKALNYTPTPPTPPTPPIPEKEYYTKTEANDLFVDRSELIQELNNYCTRAELKKVLEQILASL